MSTIWENTDGFADQYRYDTALYLLSMLVYTYNIIIDSDVVSQVNGREGVDGLNAIEKKSLSMLMTNLKLPNASSYDSHTEMHTSNVNTDIILAREFQKIFQTKYGQMDFWMTVRT